MSPDVREIAVVYSPEGWRIVSGEQHWGRYAFRVDAEEAALRLSARAQRQGNDLRVLVEGRQGRVHCLPTPVVAR